MPKRTYSRRNMSMVSPSDEDEVMRSNTKRPKNWNPAKSYSAKKSTIDARRPFNGRLTNHHPVDDIDEDDALVGNRRPKNGKSANSTSAKKTSKARRRPFSGPVSIPDPDGDVDMVDLSDTPSPPKKPAKPSVLFDKPNETPAGKKQTPNIHGSLEAFQKTYANSDKWKQQQREQSYRDQKKGSTFAHFLKERKQTVDAQLPLSKPTNQRKHEQRDTERKPQHGKHINKFHPFRRNPDATPRTGLIGRLTGANTPNTATRTSAIRKTPKQPYMPKTNEMSKPALPVLDLLGRPIDASSTAADLWESNQTNSPFFQLPGEIRNCIYEYALGGKTILIRYDTWINDRAGSSHFTLPVFKYGAQIFNGFYTDPYTPYSQQPSNGQYSRPLTLLNNVSRQLYLESAVLPYKLNTWAFDANLTLFNLMRSRAAWPQWDALTSLMVLYDAPGKNILEHMTNLERLDVVHEGSNYDCYTVVDGPNGRELVKQ